MMLSPTVCASFSDRSQSRESCRARVPWTGHISEAYSGYIRAVIANNWPANHLHALNDLFFKLGIHDYAAKHGLLGKRALLTYCEYIRRLWLNDFEAGRVSFNVGDINETTLERTYNNIVAKESTAAIQTVRFF